MERVYEIVGRVSEWMRPWCSEIALVMVATLLVIYGNDLNGFVKRKVARFGFLLRFVIFIAVCAVGYGALTIAGAEFLHRFLKGLPALYLSPGVLGAFILIGLMAERKKQI